MNYDIRLIRRDEHAVLRDMLYHAIFVPPEESAPAPHIVDVPDLARIYENWGRPGDLALMAVQHQTGEKVGRHQIIGAAWYRLFPSDARSYGYVADDIPELAIAVLPAFRGRGVGTDLMRALLSRAAAAGYRALSLSVDRRNPAMNLYERLGFSVCKEGQSPTMVLSLQHQ